MQRRVLLGAGVAILVLVALVSVRFAGQHAAVKVLNTDLNQIEAALPPGYTATHGATEVDPLTGTVTLHALAVSFAGKTLWTAGTLTITGANQQALHDVFDPAAYVNGHPAWTARRLLVADATASDIRIPDDGPPPAELHVNSISLHQLSGRPFQAPPTRNQVKSPAFQADAALAFALRSLDLLGLSMQANAPQPSRLTIGAVTLRDYDGGKFGRAELENIATEVATDKPTPTAIHGTVASIEVRDLDAVSPLKKLQLGAPAGKSALAGLHSNGLLLNGMDIEIAPGPSIKLTSLEAHGSSTDASSPTIGQANLRGLTIALKDTPLAPGPAALIAAFGMNAITMDVVSKTITDPGSKLTKFNEDVALQDLGELKFALAVGLSFAGAPDQDPQAALMTTPIDHATLEWHDQGLVARALNTAAAQMGATPETVRAQLALPLLTLGFLMPDQPDVADQLTGFLNHPGTLAITLNPPQPITLAEIGQAPAESRAHILGAHIQAR